MSDDNQLNDNMNKSVSQSLRSSISRMDAELRLANQEELVKSSKDSIKLLEGLLENTADVAEKSKLVREIIQQQEDVKIALRQKEVIMKDMPDGEDDGRSLVNSDEKLSNVSKYIQDLNVNAENLKESLHKHQHRAKVELNYRQDQLLRSTLPLNQVDLNTEIQSRAVHGNTRSASPVTQHQTSQVRGDNRSNQQQQPPAQGQLYPSHMDILLMRDQLQSLRTFNGDPREWQMFRTSYDETKHLLSDCANLNRLRKAIVGKAAVAVGDMLTFGTDPEQVISALGKMYGNPRMVINEIFERVENAVTIKEGKYEMLVELACTVRNLSAALQNLCGAAMQHDHSLISKLEQKLSLSLLTEWGRYKLMYHAQWPSILQFSQFLDFHAEVAQEVMVKPVPSKELEANHQQSQRRRAQSVYLLDERKERFKLSCYYCEGEHSMKSCEKFSKLKLEVRRKWVKDQLRCFVCLGKHLQKDCRWKDDVKRRCGVNGCELRHWKLLHMEPEMSVVMKTNDEAEILLHTKSFSKQQVLFRVVPVKLYGTNKKIISTYAFLDDGSSVSMIEQSVADELGLEGKAADLCMRWTGDTIKCEKQSRQVAVKISGISPRHRMFEMQNVHTMRNLALPKQTICADVLKKKYKFLQDVEFESMNKATPTIMIGLKHNKLGLPNDIRQGKWHEPVAAHTRLGWVVFGTESQQSSENFSLHICECEAEGNSRLDEIYKNFVQAEEASIRKIGSGEESLEDQRAKTILVDTMKKKGDRYEVGLLWRNEMCLPDSKKMAIRRLECVEKKISRNPEMLAAYNEKIEEYLKKGYAKKLDENEKTAKSHRKWYIPHFLVFNANKPNKQRLVFDAAAKVNEVALNDALLVGPDLYCSLPGVLSKFREGKVAVASDIKEMFHQVNIRPEDQLAQRFLWRNGRVDVEPEEYAMVAMPFGLACSPCIAQWIKNENAQQYIEIYPRAVEAIKNRHYVDDLLDSFETQEEAVKVCKQITEIQKAAGFELHDWTSNAVEVARALNKSENDDIVTKSLDIGQENEKVLGLYWDTINDTLKFKLSFHKVDQEILQNKRAPTKRELLRTMMSVFDPQGMLSHFLFFVKAIFQDACRLKIEWDQVLEAGLLERWRFWLSLLPNIANIIIPRNYSPKLFTNPVELHIMTDASELAYAAVAYFVIQSKNGNEVRLVAGKSKVGPTKQRMTIPRMELMGALIGARLAARIVKEHSIQITARVFWCDNKSVLHWIRGGETWQLKPFIACRVLEILELTKSKEWRYVPSALNVADDATKWVGEPDLSDKSRWFNGPDFLKKSPENWPVESRHENNEDVADEIKTVLVMQVNDNSTSIIDPERFSQWWRMRKVMAQTLRAVKRMRALSVEKQITVEEYQEAELVILKQAQREAYPIEIASLEKSPVGRIQKSSELHILSPYLDECSLLRMSGRIDKASCVNDWTKRPVIMPANHRITELLVAKYHKKYPAVRLAVINVKRLVNG